jgi:hypothetical protein
MKDRIPSVQQWVHLVYMDEVVDNSDLMHSWLENRQHGRRTAAKPPQVVATPRKKEYDPSNIFRGFNVECRQTHSGQNEFVESNNTATKLNWGGFIMDQVSAIVRRISTCGFVACGLDDAEFDGMSFAHTSYSSMNETNSMQSRRNTERNEILPPDLGPAAFSFSLEDSVTNSSFSMSNASIPTGLALFQRYSSPAYVEPNADTNLEAFPVGTTETIETDPRWDPFPTSREGPELLYPPSHQHQVKSSNYADNLLLTSTPKLEVPFEQRSGSPSNEDIGVVKDENDDDIHQEEREVYVKQAIPEHQKIPYTVSLQPKTRRIHSFGFFRTNPAVPVDPSSILVHGNSEKNKETASRDTDWSLERDPAIIDLLLGPDFQNYESRALQITPSFTSSACTGSTRTTKRHKNGRKKDRKRPTKRDIEAAIASMPQ